MRFNELGNLVLETGPEIQALTTNRHILDEPYRAELDAALLEQEALVPFPHTHIDRLARYCISTDELPTTRINPKPEFVISTGQRELARVAAEATLSQPFHKLWTPRKVKIISAAQNIATALAD